MEGYFSLQPRPAFNARKGFAQSISFGSGGIVMSKALTVLNQFKNDEDGAALIEYTVLLGLMLVAVVATIGLVGTWVSGQWTTLNAGL
jgi:pilus assembly protein Flp/PilA